MIRTYITPTENHINVPLDLPDDYLGQELELIVFKKQEGLAKEKTKTTMADFWGSISDETAKKLHENVTKMRNEWERGI
jgi:hypothetical protein